MSHSNSELQLPDKTKLQVIEQSPDRLVLHIAGGGPRARGMGCFALFWNLFMVCFTPPWFFAMADDGFDAMWFVAPIIGLFWLIGLGMAYWWARMRFTRLNLLIEPERVAVQKIFFRRVSTEETTIDTNSTVELVESYQENDNPVYAVAVSGIDHEIKFGTPLSGADKRYLVRSIRNIIGGETAEDGIVAREFRGNCESCGSALPKPEADDIAVVCEQCGRSHTGTVVTETVERPSQDFDDLAPADLPDGSLIAIDDSNPLRFQMEYPAIDPKWDRLVTIIAVIVGIFTAGFLLIPLNFFIPLVLGGNQPLLQFALSLGVLLIAGIVAVRASRGGTIRVVLDHDWLRCSYRLGPIHIKQSAAVADIEDVVITNRLEADDLVRRRGNHSTRSSTAGQAMACVVNRSGKRIPLTWGHDRDTTREVAGLIRGKLRELAG